MTDYTNTRINQSGKSGGDTSGVAGAGSSAYGGAGSALASGMNVVGPMSLSAQADGGIADSAASAMAGGDVTDNTSIGNININS